MLLSDIVVVDLTRALAGPHAALMLGDLGARVIKVETPGSGDDSRGWGPPFVGPDDEPVSTYFLSANRNKESVTADLKSDDGKQLLTRLVRQADVLVENFRTGVLDRLGAATFDELLRRWPQEHRDTVQDRRSYAAWLAATSGQDPAALTAFFDEWLTSPTSPS